MGNSSDHSIPNSPRSPSSLAPLIASTAGSAGFIGFHTCVALLERGDDVVVVDELNDYYNMKLKQSNLDYLAARAGVRPSIDDPLLYIYSNATATTVILEACRRFRITKFVYASSSSVYGGCLKEFFSEQDIVAFPVSPYAATKKSCELLAHTYHHLYHIECIGLRFFTVYGPRGRPDTAPFKFMDRIARGVSIDQYGDSSSSRDYTYIDDIVQGVLLSLDKAHGCEVFNLGLGTPTDLMDFIAIIEGLVGEKAQINILPMQPGDVSRTCSDISKAKRLLGHESMTPLSEGLEKTWAWYRTLYRIQSDDSSSDHDKSQHQRG